MFDFESQQHYFNLQFVIISNVKNAKQKLFKHEYNLFITLRNENKFLTSEIVNYIHKYVKTKKLRKRILELKNLMIVRYYKIYNKKKKN